MRPTEVGGLEKTDKVTFMDYTATLLRPLYYNFDNVREMNASAFWDHNNWATTLEAPPPLSKGVTAMGFEDLMDLRDRKSQRSMAKIYISTET